MEWKSWYLNRNLAVQLNKQFSANEFHFLVGGAFGDVYFTLAMTEELFNIYGDKVNIVVPSNYKCLALRQHAISSGRVRLTLANDLRKLQNAIMQSSGIHVLSQGSLFPTLITLHPLLGEAVISNRLTHCEAQRLILGLPVGAPANWGRISESRVAEFHHLLDSHVRDKDRTVLYCPVVNSNSPIPEDFSASLVERLLVLGFTVLVNISGDLGSRNYDYLRSLGCTFLELPADMVVEFCGAVKCVITAASGLAAILSWHPHGGRVLTLVRNHTENVNGNAPTVTTPLPPMRDLFREDFAGNSIEELYFSSQDDKDLFLERVTSFVMEG